MVSRAHGQKTILIDFPIDSYFGAIGQTSDVDGDGTPDTIITHDEALEMLITDDGTLHVWAGNYWLYDDAPDVEGWTYFPLSAGIWYWNSLTEETKLINVLIDWNNDDGANDPFAGIGAYSDIYPGISFTSMPGAAYDEATGKIYLTYTMPIEYSDLFGDPTITEAQSFRDIFGIHSDDNGATWSHPLI
jgi:hypothetical protein